MIAATEKNYSGVQLIANYRQRQNMRLMQYANKAFWLATMILLTMATIIARTTKAFVPLAPPRHAQHQRLVVHPRRDCRLLAIKRMPGETEKAYFQRVTAAAADPVAFERLVAGNSKQSEPDVDRANSTEVLDGIGSTDNSTRRSGYVRAEEWEAEQQRKRKSGELSWEERVAFDGQRHGDRFAQNEILRRNLKLW